MTNIRILKNTFGPNHIGIFAPARPDVNVPARYSDVTRDNVDLELLVVRHEVYTEPMSREKNGWRRLRVRVHFAQRPTTLPIVTVLTVPWDLYIALYIKITFSSVVTSVSNMALRIANQAPLGWCGSLPVAIATRTGALVQKSSYVQLESPRDSSLLHPSLAANHLFH
nr:hypothetical protein CFP56_72645 [Quercus suber]